MTSHPRSFARAGTRTASTLLSVAALLAALLVGGCRAANTGTPDATPSPDATAPRDGGFPPPRTDLVPAVGRADAIDIATWNIENFPATPDSPRVVADLIASLDIDLLAVQEIASIEAFNELVERLPNHSGILSSHTYNDGTYQKVGFVFRDDLLAPSGTLLLFTDDGFNFPRPGLRVDFAVLGTGVDFTAIAVHLKAGTDTGDVARREVAIQRLDEYVRAMVDGPEDDDVIVLGDFNASLTSGSGQQVMTPWLNAPERYDIKTEPLSDAGLWSFIPGEVLLDHIVVTSALADELAGGSTQIPRLDVSLVGYEAAVSDHLPVVTAMPVL